VKRSPENKQMALTEGEIKSALFAFHSANENLLSAFLTYGQAVEAEANSEKKVDIELVGDQVQEIMDWLIKGAASDDD